MSGHGIFNVCNDLSACYAHESKTGTEGSALVLTQKNWKMVFHSSHAGVKPKPLKILTTA